MQNEFYIQWHITNQCRNRCLHCYQSKYNGENVILDQADFILANIKECGAELDAMPYILITGGDPMENPHFFEILERSMGVSNRVGILGNPEPIISDSSVLSRLVDLKIDSYQVSLDGLEKTHDTWRRRGSFRKTLQAIELLNKAGVWVNVMSTVSKENYKEMIDVMSTAYKYGANFWTFTRYAPANGGHCGIDAEEFTIFMEEITEALKPYEEKGKPAQTREPLLCQIKEGLGHHEMLGGCGVGFSRMALLPDNTVMACRRHPGSILGKVDHEHSILWHFAMNPKMDKYRDFSTIKGCNKCSMLNQCRGCRAIAYLATNNEDGDDPQCLLLKKKRVNAGIMDENYFVACNTPFGVKCS